MTATSTLSVGGIASARASGFRPLGAVVGASVYRIGRPRVPVLWGRGGYEPVSLGDIGSSRVYTPKGGLTIAAAHNEGSWTELADPTQVHNAARVEALTRLRESAHALGAAAVVATRIERRATAWSSRAVEVTAVGTAVDGPWTAGTAAEVAAVRLSAQELLVLLEAGYRPLGLVGGSSVGWVSSGYRTKRARRRLSRSSRRNQEYEDYTNGLYAARRAAMGHLRSEARALGAAGIVGIAFELERRSRSRLLRGEKDDLLLTTHVLGTAIGAAPVPDAEPVLPVVDLGATR